MPNMPQDSLRSVVYRSFVTCDDPKGVIDCKTIRKSKSNKVKDKIKNKKMQQDSNMSSSYEEVQELKLDCKGSTQELHNLSSFQIMEVSKGANKLNQVIDSLNFDPRSNYIAKDLLKGALDLQESLQMLGKLQEASRHISNSKKKHKERNVGETVYLGGTDFIKPYQFGDCAQAMDFQKPKTSVASSSRDCYEELREIITESFARQNLLSKESHMVQRNRIDYCMDVPSSSSSQSSLFHSCSSDLSPSKLQHEKPKGPNLIAKLMGLEEVSSKRVNSKTYKHMENEKHSRLLLDNELRRTRKPQSLVHKPAQERRTLEETIETMQFKGLIEKAMVHGSYLRNKIAIEDPPIVIMRPRQVFEHGAKELYSNYYVDEEIPIQNKRVPRKTREEFTELNDKLPARRTLKQKGNKDKECKNIRELHVRPIKKTTDIFVKPSSEKIKHLKPLCTKVQKKEASVKVIEDAPKSSSYTRKKAEIKVVQSQDPLKTIVLKHSKPGRGPNVSKCHNVQGKASIPDIHMSPSTSVKSYILKKKLKKDTVESKHNADSVEIIPSGNNLSIDIEEDIQVSSMKRTTSEQVPMEVTSTSHTHESDRSENAPSYVSESSEPTIEEDVKYIDNQSFIEIHNFDEMKDCKSTTTTKHLLLQSVPFLRIVNELFDGVAASPTTTLPSSHEFPNSFLLLECAKELVELKRLRNTKEIYPLSQNLFIRPKYHFSLDQLVHEISDGIEDLVSYGNIILVDSVYAMLERDLRSKGEVMGAWDLGWRYGFTMDEVHEVVNDLEKLVLSEIVDDFVGTLYDDS